MASSPIKRSKIEVLSDEIAELRAENRRLLERLGLGERYVPIHKQTQGIPELEDLFDVQICGAIITHRGNVYNILRVLDYPVSTMSEAEQTQTMRELLARPGVMDALSNNTRHLSGMKDKIVARYTELALDGDLNAAQFLARVAGWYAPTKVDVRGQVGTTNIFAFLTNPETQTALAKLKHEPGEAVAISGANHTIEQEPE